MVPIELDGRRLGELRLIDAPRGSADSPAAERIGRVLAGLVALGQEREQRLAHEVESEALRARTSSPPPSCGRSPTTSALP